MGATLLEWQNVFEWEQKFWVFRLDGLVQWLKDLLRNLLLESQINEKLLKPNELFVCFYIWEDMANRFFIEQSDWQITWNDILWHKQFKFRAITSENPKFYEILKLIWWKKKIIKISRVDWRKIWDLSYNDFATKYWDILKD